MGKGMFMNGLFYFSMLILEKVNTNPIEKIINKLFFKIGEGSYAIYALHYPLLIYFEYGNLSFFYQLLFVPIFIFCCYKLEKSSLNWNLNFLEIDYLKPLKYLK